MQNLREGQNFSFPTLLDSYRELLLKRFPLADLSSLVSSSPTERNSSFVDSLLQPIAQKQESYTKDTKHFLNFIENMPTPDEAILRAVYMEGGRS